MSMSSLPSEPSSPACGLRPEIASRGRARPKWAFRSATAIRAVVTISSLVSWASASRSERWMVTGTTASAGDHSIITGCGARPPLAASSARNSVWPGWRNPARYSTLLAIGLVTTAPALPRLTWSTAWRMEASAAVALVSSGCPGRAVAISPVATTGKAFANAAPASSGRHRQARPAIPGFSLAPRRTRGRRADRTAEGPALCAAARLRWQCRGRCPRARRMSAREALPCINDIRSSRLCGGRSDRLSISPRISGRTSFPGFPASSACRSWSVSCRTMPPSPRPVW